MLDAFFHKFNGLMRRSTSVAAPQLSFRKLDNFRLSKRGDRYALVKRGGSSSYDVTGDLYGISGYNKTPASHGEPNRDIPIRHRRVASTSYIEKLSWSLDTWSAITLGANTSFGIGGVMDFAQIKDLLCLCGGRPAKITDIDSGNVEKLGGSAPATPSAAPTTGAATLTGTYRHVITFVDENSGWESSPSDPTTAQTAASEDIALTSIPAVADREGVTHVYIYRTINTNEDPYRYSGKVTLGTTTYTDAVADASLGSDTAPDFDDHNAPPSNAYVVEAYKERLWIASGSELWYSLPDDGTGVPLEYFSPDRVLRFPARVTALKTSTEGELYIFNPPRFGISAILGRFTDDEDFQVVEKFRNEGTYFNKSVAVGGNQDDIIAFWGDNGPAFIKNGAILSEKEESAAVPEDDIASAEYDTNIYVSTVWDAVQRKFHFIFAGIDDAGFVWESADTGETVEWINVSTGDVVPWEIV